MRQTRQTRVRRRAAAIAGLLIVALAAVVVGVVWSDQAASAQAGSQLKERTIAEVPADTDGVDSEEAAGTKDAPATTLKADAGKGDDADDAAVARRATISSSAPSTARPTSSTSVSGVAVEASESATVVQAAASKSTKIKLKVYLVKGEKLVAVTRQVDRTTAVGGAALKQLLSGPTKAEKEKGLVSAVPQGTRLRGLSIKNGVATVDLTRDFASGGGSSSMYLRLGQVVYTLTEFPTVDEVRLWLDGAPVKALGGEGLLIPGPLSRNEWGALIR